MISSLVTQLNNLGLSYKISHEIANAVTLCLKQGSFHQQTWQCIVQQILTHPHYKPLPFSVHNLLYKTIYPECDRIPGAAWFPTQNIIKTANITKLMQTLGFHNYQELHHWTISYYQDFWHQMIQIFPIVFTKHYQNIVDLNKSITAPKWLSGAMLNIAQSCFQANSSDVAIIYQTAEGQLIRMTYQELDDLSNRVAVSIQCYCQVGDRIAIIMPMTMEAVAIYLGVIKAGCCVVSIADSFVTQEIEIRLNIAKVKAIFTQDCILRDGKRLPLYDKIRHSSERITIVLPANHSIHHKNYKINGGDISWENFLITDKETPIIACEPQAYTSILFSSGTTSEPKAIPWDHVTPIKCGSDAYLYQNIQAGDVLCWPTNLGWMMGPWLIYASLLNRASIALYDGNPNRKEFGQFIQNAKVTVLGLVPTHVRNWRLSGCMEGCDWSFIKLFSSSGECSNISDMLYLMSLADYRPIIEYCGGTEIGGAYLSSIVTHPSCPSTFNAPTLGMDFLLLDEQGLPTQDGEIALIPPSIGLSTDLLNNDHYQVYYANMPHSPSGQILRRHGDHVERLAANGLYRMHGRIDDTMNLGGIKISSVEIESVLNQIPFVRETAAISIILPNDGLNQLVIYAVLNKEMLPSSLDSEQLKITMQHAIKTHLNPLFKIYQVMVVDSLPRTGSNKMMRRLLRDQFKVG